MPLTDHDEVIHDAYQTEQFQSDEGSALQHSELGLPRVRGKDGRPR